MLCPSSWTQLQVVLKNKMKKNLPTQDNIKEIMQQTLKNILSCVGGVYYNKYKLKLERKKVRKNDN